MKKKLTVLFVSLSLLTFGGAAFTYFKIITFNDISIEAVYPLSNPDLGANTFSSRKPVYLISYADGDSVYFKNQNALTLSAINKGIDIFINYRRSLLDPDFVRENKDVLDEKYGAGYWLWKPWIILHTLKNAPEGSILIYSDLGFVFSGTSVMPLINYGKKHDINVIEYNKETYGTVGRIARREMLMNMNCDNETCRAKSHIWAAFLILKNSPKSRAFIEEWLRHCTRENLTGKIIDKQTGQPIPVKQHPENTLHHHDEAVLSAVCAMGQHEVNYIPDEEFLKYVQWHHRKGNREGYSLLPDMQKMIGKLEKRALNLSFVRAFRHKLLAAHSPSYVRSEKSTIG